MQRTPAWLTQPACTTKRIPKYTQTDIPTFLSVYISYLIKGMKVM